MPSTAQSQHLHPHCGFALMVGLPYLSLGGSLVDMIGLPWWLKW